MFFGTQPDDTLFLPGEMGAPELLIPGRKPVGPVEIDWDHPLSDFGYFGAWLFGTGNSGNGIVFDLLQTHPVTKIGTNGCSAVATTGGQMVDFDNPNAGVYTSALGAYRTKDYTQSTSGGYVVVSYIADATYANATIFSHYVAGARLYVEIQSDLPSITIGTGSAQKGSATFSPGTVINFVASWGASGGALKTWVNGAQQVSTTVSGYAGSATANATHIGGGVRSGVYEWPFNGKIGVLAVGREPIPDGLAQSLSCNPYQFLKPKTAPLVTYTPDTRFALPDSRVEAPSLYIPKRKPIGPVEIDWEHKFTDGLIGGTIGRGSLIEQRNGGGYLAPSLLYPGWTNGERWVNADNEPWEGGPDYGIVTRFIVSSLAGTSYIHHNGYYTSSSNSGGFFVSVNTSGDLRINVFNNNAPAAQGMGNGTVSAGVPYILRIHQWDGGYTQMWLYDDKTHAQVGSLTHSFSGGRNNTSSVWNAGCGGVYGSGYGHVDWSYWYDHEVMGRGRLTEDRALAIARDPYQFLIPA